MNNNKPNYIKIFKDIIEHTCPDRVQEFSSYLKKENLSIIEVIELNNKIFKLQDKDTLNFNQKHKSYDQEAILQMLAFQKKERLNNVELANYFKLSRNTVSKWKSLCAGKKLI